MKITPQQVIEMKKLRDKGMILQEIAEKYGVTFSTVYYWVKEGQSAKQRKRCVENFKRLPESKKKEIYQKRGVYFKSYFKNRYHNDPIFRSKHIKTCIEGRKKRLQGIKN